MEYFELTLSDKVTEPLKISDVDSKCYKYHLKRADFDVLDQLVVGYFSNKSSVEITDILLQPTFLISNEIKKLFSLYDEQILFKGIQLFPIDGKDKVMPLYWVPWFKEIHCLHSTTKKYTNGLIEELVLEEQKIVENDIFRVADIIENKIILSLPVVESLLRRGFYGLKFNPIKVR